MATSRRAPQVPGESLAEPEVVDAHDEPSEQPAAPGVLRAADVDPTSIRRAVLTADGWVCPAAAPAAPVKE